MGNAILPMVSHLGFTEGSGSFYLFPHMTLHCVQYAYTAGLSQFRNSFNSHCTNLVGLRHILTSPEVPNGLKERILAGLPYKDFHDRGS